MKRSEMLDILEKEIYKLNDEFGPIGLQVNAIRLLKVIEEKGMLPPEIEVQIEGNKGIRTYKRNEWDEE